MRNAGVDETQAGIKIARICSTAEIVVAAVLAVNGVPGMGQIHKIPLIVDLGGDSSGSLGEGPLAVQVNDLSQVSLPPTVVWLHYTLFV